MSDSGNQTELFSATNEDKPSFLYKIRNLVSRQPELFDFSTFDFAPLDIQEATKELQIKEKAKENGESALPNSGDTQLDATHGVAHTCQAMKRFANDLGIKIWEKP